LGRGKRAREGVLSESRMGGGISRKQKEKKAHAAEGKGERYPSSEAQESKTWCIKGGGSTGGGEEARRRCCRFPRKKDVQGERLAEGRWGGGGMVKRGF